MAKALYDEGKANALRAMSKEDPRHSVIYDIANGLGTSINHVLAMAQKSPGMLAKALAAKKIPPPEAPKAAVGEALKGYGADESGQMVPIASGKAVKGYGMNAEGKMAPVPPPAASPAPPPGPKPPLKGYGMDAKGNMVPISSGKAVKGYGMGEDGMEPVGGTPGAGTPPVIPAPVPVPGAGTPDAAPVVPAYARGYTDPQAAAIAAAQSAVKTATQDSTTNASANPLLTAALSGLKAPAAPGYLSPLSPPTPHALPIDKGESLLAALGLGARHGTRALGG